MILFIYVSILKLNIIDILNDNIIVITFDKTNKDLLHLSKYKFVMYKLEIGNMI